MAAAASEEGAATRKKFLQALEKSCVGSASKSETINQEILEKWGIKNVILRDYQITGVQWLSERLSTGHGCILGDEMGLGKTLQSISLLAFLHKSAELEGPFLILVPLSVVRNWESELKRFYPQFKVLDYSGGKEKREEVKEDLAVQILSQGSGWNKAKYPFHIMLAHYEVAIRDGTFLSKIPWQCLIVDEGHRLKNSSSVLYQQLKELRVQRSILLTGTPVQNNLNELYSLLSFVAPKIFPLSKSDSFVRAFSNVKDDQVSATLHKVLKPFLLRRLKNEVVQDLPGKSEVILYTGLSATQKKLYKAVLLKDYDAFESGKKTRLMNILIQLRKCVNHPYLFDGVEPEPFEIGEHIVEASGKLFLLDKMLSHLKQKGHRVLIFSQMTRMLDIIQDYLGFRGYSYERLDGSIRGEERFLAVQNFTDNEETFIFLLSTRAGGQGLNLAGADTIVFVDSDYNPQSDLQAAARAHRIGQTRPVKVVRLISRHTVEEIILHRANSKLELTNTVIEGGQFSGLSTAGEVGGDSLSDILKFGLDHIVQSEDSTIADEDLESILGSSEGGEWVLEEAGPGAGQIEAMDKEEEENEAPQNMYVYDGQDYSKLSDDDKKTFDQLLAEQLSVSGEDGERILRSEQQRAPQMTGDLALPSRKRKTLTPQQLEERRKKREENRIKRMKLLEEKERQKLEEKKRKLLERWKRNDYTSKNISMSSDEDEEDEEQDEEEGVDIQYMVGDVTQPQCAGREDAIVVHCVDDSGRWGRGGLFSAISARSTIPQTAYEEAGRIKDLALGDAHLVDIDDLISREQGKDMLSLIVAQTRSGRHVSAIKLSALGTGFSRVARIAKRRKGRFSKVAAIRAWKTSVHLPRIGHSTPQFNWYGTERLIRKHFSARGIPTFIYYFKISQSVKKAVDGPPMCGPSSVSDDIITSIEDPLPQLFQDMVFLFSEEVSEEDRETWSRYIIAYDGEVADSSSSQVTHLVCSKDEDSGQDGQVKKVSIQWLSRCLKQRKVET